MTRLQVLYQNHVLANLVYALLIVLGCFAFSQLPKEISPQGRNNSAVITVSLIGASAEDIERLLIVPIERILHSKIRNIKQVKSEAQGGFAFVSISFEEVTQNLYEKRMQELRREVQVLAQTELPKSISSPEIFEGTAEHPDVYGVVIYSPGNDENFRRQAHQAKLDLQQMPGVMRVELWGSDDPEVKVMFNPEKLSGLAISAIDLADTVSAYFQDTPAGVVKINKLDWLVRISGTENATQRLANLPILTAKGIVKLGDIADIIRAGKKSDMQGRYLNQPSVTLILTKQPGANSLSLIDQIKTYIVDKNIHSAVSGVQFELMWDESDKIRKGVSVMIEHAWSGMMLVALVSWLFLGWRLSLLTTLTVPFSLAGVFLVLYLSGQSLNLSVLLGVIIVLGMLVDDAIVIIEAINQQLRHAHSLAQGIVLAVQEVWVPVITSSLTTIATFVPLMMMKGYVGVLMGVVPQVVTIALLISIVQAIWILPAHSLALLKMPELYPKYQWREKFRSQLMRGYMKLLIQIFRRPLKTLLGLVLMFVFVVMALNFNWVKFNLLPANLNDNFSIALKMQDGVSATDTLNALEEVEQRVKGILHPDELLRSQIQSGGCIKDGRFLIGNQYGSVWFGLKPNSREINALKTLIAPELKLINGVVVDWFEEDESNLGGNIGKAIQLNISGNTGKELDEALSELKSIVEQVPGTSEVKMDITPGITELKLTLDSQAIQRAGVSPITVTRTLKLLADGEIVVSYTEQNEPVVVRVQGKQNQLQDISELLRYSVPSIKGINVPLSQLVTVQQRTGAGLINHTDYRSVRVIQADLDKSQTDTLAANQLIQNSWDQIKDRYPTVTVQLGGEVETVKEGLTQLWQLFALGLGLILMIVGAQFQSYGLPFLVLCKIPMAFAGVILGLFISQESISLYTLYGGVALAGIAVNSAILMFSAGHDRLKFGMTVVHASLYAARRRFIPILITSLTTLVGLLPLALSDDKSSVQWQPVANAIVWGVGFSTLLTLFMMPLLYRLAMDKFLWRKARGKTA